MLVSEKDVVCEYDMLLLIVTRGLFLDIHYNYPAIPQEYVRQHLRANKGEKDAVV